MFTGNAEAVAREQHNDNLRRFEKANLIKQFELNNNNRFDMWQIVRSWLKPYTARQQAAGCGELKAAEKVA